jgi:enamine deaminase RidA (YjgF/YER057c/UK114 family)
MASRRINVSSGSAFEARVGYSRAVRIGPLVVVAGTTAPGDDVATQTREVLRRIEIALGEVGAALTDVVRTRMFVTDIAFWSEGAPYTRRCSAPYDRWRPWSRCLR